MSEDKILPGTELKFVGEIHGIKVLADPSVSDDEIKIAQDLILYDKSHKDALIKELVEALDRLRGWAIVSLPADEKPEDHESINVARRVLAKAKGEENE